MKPSGNTILVTGGGSGIGRACCTLFSAEEAIVVVADIKDAEKTLDMMEGEGAQKNF